MTTAIPEHELSDIEGRSVEYFDGELDASERANFEAQLAVEPQLREGLEAWTFIQDVVRGSLEAEAEALPAARFEQAWDQFDATLAREARLQDAVDSKPSLWARISAALSPVRVPLAVGAAAALAFVVYRGTQGAEGGAMGAGAPAVAQGDTPEAAPKAEGPAPAPSEQEAPAPGTQLAVAPPVEHDPEEFPAPTSNEAEIERIEFGGRSGTISQVEGSRGTTTVIWVQEDEEPVESERSL